jgi:Amidohydrolase
MTCDGIDNTTVLECGIVEHFSWTVVVDYVISKRQGIQIIRNVEYSGKEILAQFGASKPIILALRASEKLLWPTLDPLDHDKAVRFQSYHELGATGLKLYIGHGFVAPGSSGYLFSPLALDDPSMDDVYEYCAAHRLPICLHINPGAKTPGFADEFVTLLQRHPKLLVNAPHWILSSSKPDRLGELLDVFPNLVTDVSFGVDEFLIEGLRRISRNTLRIRHVLEQHPDRFLFGTDFVVTRARHKTPEWMRVRVDAYLSMLVCKQYKTPLLPFEVLNGLALPVNVFEQIRSNNYAEFRAPGRQLVTPARPVDWSRMGVPRLRRRPGERLRYQTRSGTGSVT